MRRKYFLRGMGIGIVITALIFTVAYFFNNDSMSTSEIIKQAEALGMIMPEEAKNENNNKSKDETKNNDKTTTITDSGAKVTTENKTGDEVEEPPKETSSTTKANEDKKTETSTKVTKSESSENVVSFSVRGGESSNAVAANLYKAGLVKNPNSFNTFLEKNGYDKNIHPGTYSIREGASEDSIAKILTGN